ncbi:MAG: peptidoglycan editing factor PgeF [Deltaproteobacteria bacterium]|nr:peptidoglycan editing factor PgeF [Deltaproteobacteria bacterium]
MIPPEALESPLLCRLGFRHAFFTRRGGISEGPHASLSFSVAAGDRPEAVEENLTRAAAALGVSPGHVYYLSQVHGRAVHTLGGGEDRVEVLHREGDALVSAAEGQAVGVRSADCLPVLFADPRSGRVAAAHAGWRGLVAGVLGATVDSLVALGARPAELVAAIGPHIGAAAFEVSEEVAAQLVSASPDPEVVARAPGGRPHVALGRVARAQLLSAGLAPAHVESVEGCTRSEPHRFFSFRRDGRVSGRHLSAIVPRPGGSPG